MSATPIPRSLALIIYGDLDVSVLDELPPGREKVDTFCVTSAYHERLLAFIRKLCGEGRQIFVVCPKVESVSQEEDVETAAEVDCDEELKSAVAYAEMLRAELPGLKIACLHGRMKPAEKDAVMRRMIVGELNVLVSTTVIEVGVNVPNATVMVIENAERFGLAQLHQLRGRVGRGTEASWCFLMAEPNARLKFLASTTDGFKIAQKDMELRGPGELFGTRQSGALSAGIGSLAGDAELLKLTHDEARSLMAESDSPEARTVIGLARERFADRLRDVAVN
jgi:ATP-dependent DNA helicase RecG